MLGVLNSAIFNSFHNQVEFGMILEGLQNFGGGGFEPPGPPPPPPWYVTDGMHRDNIHTHIFHAQQNCVAITYISFLAL